MDCSFTYILPGFKLSLSDAHTMFLKNKVPTIPVHPTAHPATILRPKQYDAHVRAYHHWKRQENGCLHQKIWQQEELTLCKQEEAWAIAQQQKRVRLKVELRNQKDNTPMTPITLKSNVAQATMPTVAPRKPHMVKTAMLQQVPEDREEQCEGPACRGQGKVAWVLNTQELDEEEEDLVKIKFFVCNTCNNKHRKRFDTHTIISHAPYVTETKTISKEIISWMSDELITLLDILPVGNKKDTTRHGIQPNYAMGSGRQEGTSPLRKNSLD